MKYHISEIVYPEGDRQEITHTLTINQAVDINGYPLRVPVASVRMIAYRVYKKTTREERNEIVTSYYLYQLTIEELESLAASG